MHSITMNSPTHLPYDLERTILEFVAEADRPMALRLMLVSHEVKRWIEPILYRHIKLSNTAQTEAFIHTLDALHSKSPSLFSNTVKSISFTYAVTLSQAAKILATCTNITTLSTNIELSRQTLDISLDAIQNLATWMTAPSPALRRLSVTVQPFFICPEPDFRAPILQNLTHLSIFGSSCHKFSWIGLDTLQHLTHFMLEIDTTTPLRVIYNLISCLPPLLRIFLVVISVKGSGTPLEEYLSNNKKEVERLICGDVDNRIAVATTEEPDALDALKAACARDIIPVCRWEDTYGDRIAWEKAEVIINTRPKSYTNGS